MKAQIVEVIATSSLTGNGESLDSPIRRVLELWSKDGQKLVSYDTHTCKVTSDGDGLEKVVPTGG